MAILDRFKKPEEKGAKKSVAAQVKKASDAKSEVKADKKAVPAKKAEKKKDAVTKTYSRLATSTILGPVVTEKAAQLADRDVLVFYVHPEANRIAVRQAFRELYKVTPVKINIIRMKGKRVRFGRIRGQRSGYKKALVFLPKGTKVDVFEGV